MGRCAIHLVILAPVRSGLINPLIPPCYRSKIARDAGTALKRRLSASDSTARCALLQARKVMTTMRHGQPI